MEKPLDSPFSGPGPDSIFWSFLAQGRFMVQRCRTTGAFVFSPRALSPMTGLPDLDWVEASGQGVVYSTTVVRQRPEKGGSYNISLVELSEGPRMLTQVVDIDPEDVKIGLVVRARIEQDDDRPYLVFEPMT